MLIGPFNTKFWSYIKILTTHIVTSTIVVLWIKHSKDKKEDNLSVDLFVLLKQKNINKAKIIERISSQKHSLRGVL